MRLCQKPQTIPFTSESALALFCFALLDNSPATTTLLCSYWTYGIRVIFSVTARITTNINTKTKQKIPYPNTSSCTFTHSLGDASSRLSFQRHADQHTNTHGRHFREPFLSRRREQHQHRNRSWSDLAWRREGLAGKGGRAVFAEGSCFFFFYGNHSCELFSSLTTLRVGYTPRLLRSCLLLLFGFLGLP